MLLDLIAKEVQRGLLLFLTLCISSLQHLLAPYCCSTIHIGSFGKYYFLTPATNNSEERRKRELAVMRVITISGQHITDPVPFISIRKNREFLLSVR